MKVALGCSILGWGLILACAPAGGPEAQEGWDWESDVLASSSSPDDFREEDCGRFPDIQMQGWSEAEEDSPEESPEPVIVPVVDLGCPDGVICPESYPFSHAGSTSDSWSSSFDHYSCDPEINESGPETIYRVVVEEESFLSAAVYDGLGVDVDVHILSAPDPLACVQRGHHDVGALVEAGVYYVVVDTWANADGPLAGEYVVHIGLTVPSRGPCDMESGIMERVGDGGDHLVMPATGPVVMEAHLVTDEEPPPYPAHPTENLAGHYGLSQELTGFVMNRDQVWAPLEGGNFHGAGIGSPTKFPAAHEAWYVCMYWTSKSRPDKGTRMIFQKPGTDLAVVVAAGYETGPGNLKNIGGTVEETHFFLKTGHKSTLTLGIAEDQALPFGPRICE